MLLTLTTTHSPATDLGFLLRKNPARAQTFPLSFGQAHVVWPEATPERATCALLVDVDPVQLVRGRPESQGNGPLAAYVNDRPYVASSFMGVALSRVFGSALNGKAKERPDLVETALPLVIEITAVRRPGGAFSRRLFEPLGYTVEGAEEGHGPLRLTATVTLRDALRHLYVLLPALDGKAHYWVGKAEVQKLVAKGGEWLAHHPALPVITRRYLRNDRALARAALQQLEIDTDEPEAREPPERREASLEKPLRLNDLRLDAAAARLLALGAQRVVDLGCGEGRLLERLVTRKQFTEIVGVDPSARALEIAERRLDRARTTTPWQERVRLLHGSATYRDDRLLGFDAVALVEVIEHIDANRLGALERAVFGHLKPRAVLVSTPNREYNVRFEGLSPGRLRHADHRFEWTRAEFEAWARRVAAAHGYTVTFEPIGVVDDAVGPPTQMGVFECAN